MSITKIKTEKFLDAILDYSPDLVVIYDLKGNIININGNLLRILGYKTKYDVLKLKITDILKYSNSHLSKFLKSLLNKFKRIEYNFITTKSSFIPATGFGFPYKIGDLDVIVNISIAIQEKKKLQKKLLETKSRLDNLMVKIPEIRIWALSQKKDTVEFLKKGGIALKESENKYKEILESINEGYFEVDFEGNLLFFNNSLNKILGYPPEELIGKNFKELINIEDRNQNASINITDFVGESIEFEITKKNGENIYLDTKLSKKYDSIGEFIGFFGLIRDITEKKESELKLLDSENRLKNLNIELEKRIKLKTEKLRESEEKYRLISDNANDVIMVIDENLKTEYVNKVSQKISGYTEEELKEKYLFEFVHPEDIIKAKKIYMTILKNSTGIGEFRIRCKDGSYIWLGVNGKKIYDKNEKLKFIFISRDITDNKLMEQEIKKSEEKYRSIIERNYNGYYELDLDGNYTYANKRICDYLGYSKKELIGKNFRSVVKDEDIDLITKDFKLLYMNQLEQLITEISVLTKDGRERLVEVAAYLKRDINDNIIGFYGLTRDMDLQKQLKESEENYRLISENANDLIRVLNLGFKFEYINENVHRRLLGYDRGDLIGQSHLPLIHPEDRRHAIRSTLKILKKGDGSYQARFKNKDGIFKWLEFSGKYFIDGKGEKKILSIARDINDRKLAELMLRDSEEKYRLITENANDIICIINDKFKLEFVNEEPCFRITGYKAREIIGRNTLTMLHPDDVNRAIETLEQGIIEGEGAIETRLQKKNGEFIWLDIKGKVYRGEKEDLKIILTARDVSFRKKTEKQLRDSEEKYHMAYDQVNFYKDLFTHDINNILQTIQTSTELSCFYLNTPEKLSEIQEMLHLINKHVHRGNRLILNVRRLSQIEDNNVPLKSIDVFPLLHEAIKYIQEGIQEKGISINVNCPFKKFNVNANDLLLDVFENLLINAIRYNNKSIVDILIKISNYQKNSTDYLKFEFIDNGIGVSEDIKKIIFQNGFKKEKKSKGMGLGLSLVKKIINSYNGQIWVEERVKGDYTKGSKFLILIPGAN